MGTPEAAIAYYFEARDWVLSSNYYQELLWQASFRYDQATETQLLREHAWVVLNTGFREATVRKRFDYISLCFCDWESAESIVASGDACVTAAMASFRNERKLCAILGAAELIHTNGFREFSEEMKHNPVGALLKLPYIGPVTALHLAKNLGLNVMKPDRHLVRLAASLGYDDAAVMCSVVAQASGDSESTIDLVLWRFQEQTASAH